VGFFVVLYVVLGWGWLTHHRTTRIDDHHRPNIDWCETHQVETLRTNVIGTLNVAEAAHTKVSQCGHEGDMLMSD
jgi:hypothetical protein